MPISMRMRDDNAYLRVTKSVFVAGAVVSVMAAIAVSPVSSPDLDAANQPSAPLTCNLTQYKANTGLTTALEGDLLTVSWNGQGTSQLRARFAIDGGTPTVRDLSLRRGSDEWAILGQNLTPEYQVTTGIRRMSDDLANAFASLGIDVTQEVIDKNRWYAFWDAPFSIPGYCPATGRGRGAAPQGAPAVQTLGQGGTVAEQVAAIQSGNRGRRGFNPSPNPLVSLGDAVSVCPGRRKKYAEVSPRSLRLHARSRATATVSR
jgi:hypothetical protein